MNICLYGASSDAVAMSYVTATEKLGKLIAEHGHNLVYGGGALGLMGAAAHGVLQNGGKIIGIAPTFFQGEGVLFKECTEFIYTETMRERKKIMSDKSEAFIMVPGGPGTLDEFFEILTLKQLGKHNKAIAIYNVNGYFDNLNEMLKTAVEKGFMQKNCLKLCESFEEPEKLLNYIENYSAESLDVSNLKLYVNSKAVKLSRE